MYTILEQLFFNFQFNDTLSYEIVLQSSKNYYILLIFFFFLKNQFHGNIISWSINYFPWTWNIPFCYNNNILFRVNSDILLKKVC